MNKFDRVISTLILLQTKKIITAEVISERFGTSLRTVYRDINTLKNAGIPIISDPGIGYSIMDGYRLPPIMFNEKEAAALFTAEKFIGKIADKDTQAYYSNAMMKIKAILRSAEKQSLAVLEDSVAISEDNSWQNKTYLQDIFKSITSKQILNIQYQKADGTVSIRKLEPIGCFYQYNNWYLVAFCQLKKAYRTFKVNRITTLHLLEQRFDTKHINLKDYIDRQSDTWKKKHQFQNIEIAFNKPYVKHADRRKYYFGFVEQTIKNDAVYMKFQYASIEFIARWLLQFGNQATVIAPLELKNRLKTLATQLYEHYN